MAVEGVHKEYVQKSQIFLYPLLGIPRGGIIRFLLTYISWEGQYTPDDKKLIVTYKPVKSQAFRDFEKKHLLNNNLFIEVRELTNGNNAYIFDYSIFTPEWEFFLRGKYSRISDNCKERIRLYFYTNTLATRVADTKVVDSFLNPPKYYRDYRNIFLVDEEHFMHVGELCSKPDFIQEELTEKPKPLDLNLQIT